MNKCNRHHNRCQIVNTVVSHSHFAAPNANLIVAIYVCDRTDFVLNNMYLNPNKVHRNNATMSYTQYFVKLPVT
jgi:hypothetical protein